MHEDENLLTELIAETESLLRLTRQALART